MSYCRWTLEEDDRLRRLVSEGKYLHEIYPRFRCHPLTSTHGRCHKLGLKLKKKPYSLKKGEQSPLYLQYKKSIMGYQRNHRTELRQYFSKYRKNNLAKRCAKDERWRRANLDKVRQIQKKKLLKPSFKLAHEVRCRIGTALRWQLRITPNPILADRPHSIELLGCDIPTLMRHLEAQFQPGMGWENYGYRGWHVDHIVPCAAFDLTKEEEQRKCFHYTNLQPLWAADNIKKGKKLLEVTL